MFNIVLVEPEIPANTGNIARTCVVTNAKLHLVKPLGFSIEDKYLKRAGLDYWQHLNLCVYENLDDFWDKNPNIQFYLATTKANHYYHQKKYQPNSYFFFGKETKGLPKEIINSNLDKCIKIPMSDKTACRSLNLSNSVSIVLYEALRQNNFEFLK